MNPEFQSLHGAHRLVLNGSRHDVVVTMQLGLAVVIVMGRSKHVMLGFVAHFCVKTFTNCRPWVVCSTCGGGRSREKIGRKHMRMQPAFPFSSTSYGFENEISTVQTGASGPFVGCYSLEIFPFLTGWQHRSWYLSPLFAAFTEIDSIGSV